MFAGLLLFCFVVVVVAPQGGRHSPPAELQVLSSTVRLLRSNGETSMGLDDQANAMKALSHSRKNSPQAHVRNVGRPLGCANVPWGCRNGALGTPRPPLGSLSAPLGSLGP